MYAKKIISVVVGGPVRAGPPNPPPRAALSFRSSSISLRKLRVISSSASLERCEGVPSGRVYDELILNSVLMRAIISSILAARIRRPRARARVRPGLRAQPGPAIRGTPAQLGQRPGQALQAPDRLPEQGPPALVPQFREQP